MRRHRRIAPGIARKRSQSWRDPPLRRLLPAQMYIGSYFFCASRYTPFIGIRDADLLADLSNQLKTNK
jgi:hypothetical protein